MKNNILFHFIGIGGISMSALAVLLKNKGFGVQGSNLEENDETKMLQSHGIRVFFEHSAENMEQANAVVYNSAIKETNAELARAREKGLIVLTRAQMLASVAKDYASCIAVSGSHGKTTTTSMIGHILNCAGKNPTIHVGGIMQNYQSNFLIGDNQIFITEACEYKNNFHALSPTTLVVLNIESDHLDFFKTYSAVVQSFQTMINKSESVIIPFSNSLLVPTKTVYFCTENHICNQTELSLENKAVVWASNIACDCEGKFCYDCFLGSKKLGKITLNLPCEHNVSNSLAAIATCLDYGATFDQISNALSSFKGVKRRFETMGKIGLATAVHDYAHHPTEIVSTIESARRFCKGKVWVVFQPHTYSRTKTLMNEFLTALVEADELIILPTYAAREKHIIGGDASDLCQQIRKIFPTLHEALQWEDAQRVLQTEAEKHDIILLLGAGSIVHFYDDYINNLPKL